MGQGMRACNGNFAVLVQRCLEGKWSHVLRGPVMAPGAHCGTAPSQLGGMVSLQRRLLGEEAFWKEELCHLK